MRTSRRGFLETTAALAAAGFLESAGKAAAGDPQPRRYHLSISPDALEADPDLLGVVRRAGVTDVWVAGFFYGHWYRSIEVVQAWRRRIEQAGMAAHVINVPLGHPGDSLGAKSGTVPLTPPTRWRLGVQPDGGMYAGTSLHPPATEENVDAMRKLDAAGVKRVFLDDDFRLARGPGIIGGCFCEEHKKEFLSKGGYGESQWAELLDSVRGRSLTPVLRAWIEFACDQLTASFKAQQAAAPGIQLGIMVMYLGAEKAGIRLSDYRDVPFRVGELMFNDASFDQLKGKTNELFSGLFHRRFAKPEFAYSETTAFPADQLSAANMAAKLVVSTISDVRNTMFMSGITPFPQTHWDTLAPAMKRNAEIHARIAGHTPRGPFKHYWGEHSRSVGDDNPNSLFLASGVPFEVTDTLAKDGYTFLSDADARAAASGAVRSPGTECIIRSEAALLWEGVRTIPDSLEAMFALKHELLPGMKDIPYVEEDKPVVCAWYSEARAVLLWNLSGQRESLTVRCGGTIRKAEVGPLGCELVGLE